MNLGIRYDYMSVPRERDDRFFNRSAPFGFGPLRPPDSVYDADYLNFAPRLGFAYTVDESAKTVIRGGGGVSQTPIRCSADQSSSFETLLTSRTGLSSLAPTSSGLGLVYPITNANSLQYVRNPNAPWSNTSINTNFPNPYSIQFNLGIQRELSSTLMLETAYVGTRGVKLIMVRDYQSGGSRYWGPGSQLRAEPILRYVWNRVTITHGSRRCESASRATSCLTCTTLTRTTFPTTTGTFCCPTSRPQDINNLRPEKGPTPLRHSASVCHRFSLRDPDPPLERSCPAVARVTGSGGWQLSGVFRANSGLPIRF